MDTPPPQESEKKAKTLGDMTQVAMEHILQYCDYFDINSVRKTCTKTRHLVDLINPDPQVKSLRFQFSENTIEFWIILGNRKMRHIHYRSSMGDCSIIKDLKNKDRPFFWVFPNTTATEMFHRDFKVLLAMLKHQRAPLDSCHWSLANNCLPVFQETVAQLLTEFNIQLRTKSVGLHYRGRPEIIPMLPLICPESLQKLSITDCSKRNEILDLSQVALLDQWRRARHIHFTGYIPETLTRLVHFTHISLEPKNLLPETVTSLIEVLQNSPTFVECHVSEDVSDRIERVKAAMPPQEERNAWYFTTSTPGFVLKVDFRYTFIEIKRIANGELHGREIIHEGF